MRASRAGAHAPENKASVNNSYGTADPFNAFSRFFPSTAVPPGGRS
jgi:hypothetical protein